MSGAVWGEFVGTTVLILLGNGVVGGVLLKGTKAENAGWLAIATGWALAVFAGVAVSISMGDSDAHLNPAFTVASVIMTGHAERLWTYIPAQILGAILGAVLVWLLYMPHWSVTDDPAKKLSCFSTIPAIRSLGANFVSELIGTFVLVLVRFCTCVQTPRARWSSSWFRTAADRRSCVEYWNLAWSDYRLCHQSRA